MSDGYGNKVDAGQLRHRVEWQTFSQVRSTYNDMVDTWTTQKTLWAKVEPLVGRELEQARQINATTNYKVTLRYGPDIKETDRLKWRGKYLNIDGIVNFDGMDEMLLVMATAVTAQEGE